MEGEFLSQFVSGRSSLANCLLGTMVASCELALCLAVPWFPEVVPGESGRFVHFLLQLGERHGIADSEKQDDHPEYHTRHRGGHHPQLNVVHHAVNRESRAKQNDQDRQYIQNENHGDPTLGRLGLLCHMTHRD